MNCNPLYKVFISYYHNKENKDDDQDYKELLSAWAKGHDIYEDCSVNTDEILGDNLSDRELRERIRDEYLKDTTVTIVLVGKHTKKQKRVDWEICSSMCDGKKNKKSGIIVVMLSKTKNNCGYAGHTGEQKDVFDDAVDCLNVSKEEFDKRYPDMPKRLLDNIKNGAKISVISWCEINQYKLKKLIDNAHKDRVMCDYDISEPLKRSDGFVE